ncbi:MAG: AAA family ATPase [Asgard group archaeon]|nr:AAA family ATPase [Asgard group archaeon]
MIYWDTHSELLATGLSLQTIAEILTSSKTLEEITDSLKRFDKKYLTRYLIFKKYNELVLNGNQKLPIIPIITGIPGVGKTAIAKELATALNIAHVIGGDALRSSLRFVLPKEQNEVFFSSVYDSWKFFGDYTIENLRKGFDTQAKIMNSVVEKVIADRGLRDGESMIVEYLHFLPSHYQKDVLKHPSIIPIALVISDESIYLERLQRRNIYSHLRSSGDRLIAQREKYLLLQEYQMSIFEKYNIEVINIDDIEQGYDLVLDYLLQRIDNLNQLKDYSEIISLVNEIEKNRK